MSSKYVMITPCTKGYLPGLNANLNALDLYGNDIDVYIIDGGDLPQDYLEKVKKAFKFKVEVVQLKDFRPRLFQHRPSIGIVQYLMAACYLLMLDLKDKYDVVSLIGGDMVVVDNIMKLYEIADKTGLIVTANNPFSLNRIEDVDAKRHLDKVGLIGSMPLADVPGIMNVKLHEDVIRKTFELTNKLGDNMRCLSTAIWMLNKHNRVYVLPGNLWTCGIYYSFTSQQSREKDNKPSYYADRERLFAIHRRWWTSGVRAYALNGQTVGTANYLNAKGNVKIWEGIYRYFNTKCKVKIDYDKYYTNGSV